MTQTNAKSLKGEITEGPQKGQQAEGNIISITQGDASDYMTPEQIERRLVRSDDPFAEIEIAVEGTLQKMNFKDYSEIGAGGIPENSTMGKIMAICDIEEEAVIPMIAQETTGRPDKDGKVSKFVVWNIIGL
jgi:hypothetical protein